MKVVPIFPPLILCLVGSFAAADEKNCSELTNPQGAELPAGAKGGIGIGCHNMEG
jgi:hypothetical protein